MLSRLNADSKNIWVAITLFLLCGASIILLTSCFTPPEKINWEETASTGTILGTYEQPIQSEYTASKIYVRIKLSSGEVISIRDTGQIPLIIKGKQVKLNRGTTDSGQKFYKLVSELNN